MSNEVPKTQMAVLLLQVMQEEGLSINDLANEFDMTYEYMRRLVQGKGAMSKPVLRNMAARFKWDYKEVEKLLVQDRFRLKNGEHGALAQEVTPGTEVFVRGWNLLTKRQQDVLTEQLEMFVKQNRLNHADIEASGLKVVAQPEPKVVVKSGKKP